MLRLLVLLLQCVMVFTQKEVLTDKQIIAQYRLDQDFTTCQDQGRDFLNSAEFTCKGCSSSLIGDFGEIVPLDGLGNAQSCRCPVGYRVDEFDCTGVSLSLHLSVVLVLAFVLLSSIHLIN